VKERKESQVHRLVVSPARDGERMSVSLLVGRLGSQQGFTLTEILVAGIILVMALIPIVNMFDTSFRGIFKYEKIHRSTNCAREVLESIKAMPFYEPYDSGRGRTDIDDHFWGERNPITENPASPQRGVPDWDRIPEVTYYDYGRLRGYEEFRVTVQLSYLDDDTGVARMWSEWRPMEPGKDRPRNSANDLIHLLLVRVNVYWRAEGETRSYSLEEIITSSTSIYNVGVSGIEVLGPDSVKNPELTNAAAHYPDVEISVAITGYGFQPDVRAFLARDKHNDISIYNLRFVDSTRLEGRLRLYNTGTPGVAGEPDFYPRAAVGFWSVGILQQEVVRAYLYNGFIVQYPRPTVSDFGNNDAGLSKTGRNDQSAAELRILGSNFIDKAELPIPVLVRYAADGSVLDQVAGVPVPSKCSFPNNGYTTQQCVLVATFDLTAVGPGEYRMVVYNTRTDGTVGHVASPPSSQVYTVQAVPPVVTDATVQGSSSPRRTLYRNIGGGLNRVAIVGTSFNARDPFVEVYLSTSTGSEPFSGNWVRGVPVEVSPTLIVADFDVSGLPARNDYNVFVKNLNNNLWGKIASPSPRLAVADYSGSITNFTATSDGFWENYYDIPARIDGSGLDAAIDVTIAARDGSVEYDDLAYTVVSSSQISVTLNLIGCDHRKGWEVRVYITPGYYLKREFTVSLGRAVILPPQAAPPYAVVIERRVGSTSLSSSNEYLRGDNLYRAEAIRSGIRTREARFTVRGKGFPLPGNGTVTLRLWGDRLDRSMELQCAFDRATKAVWVTTPWIAMPNETGDYNLSVVRTGSGNSPYANYEGTRYSAQRRWRLVSP